MKILAAALSGVFLGLSAAAGAESQAAEPPPPPATSGSVVTAPVWVHKPTGDDMAANYPRRALDRNLQGRTDIHCFIGSAGNLRDCTVLDEFPEGMGFGTSGLTLARIFQMKPRAADGEKVERAAITIPISWTLGIPTLQTAPWTSVPTQDDVIGAYPPKVAGKADHVTVELHCEAQRSGSLDDCFPQMKREPQAAVSGNEEVIAFEKAAIGLANKFKMNRPWAATLPNPVQIILPIQFAANGSEIWKSRPLGKVEWIGVPDPKMIQSAFPQPAAQAGLTKGSAVVECVVAIDGQLTECAPQSETPPGLGFGSAAAEIAQRFKMNPWTETG